MITFLKAAFLKLTDTFASDEFDAVESRQAARKAMRKLTWRRWEQRWVDGY